MTHQKIVLTSVLLVTTGLLFLNPSMIIGNAQSQMYDYQYGYDSYYNDYNKYSYDDHTKAESEFADSYEDNNNNYYNSDYYPPSYEPNGYMQKDPPADIVVPIDFPKIQEAIDAANQGDVIKVLPGTYTEQINITKSLTIIGSGAKSTIIEAPDVLDNGVLGAPYIVQVSNGANVSIKGFTISGPETLICGNTAFNGLIGISVLEDATLNLDSSVIQDCTYAAIRVGAPPFLPNGPQVGHATITKTDITDHRGVGIVALISGSTLTITKSNIIGFDNSNLAGQTGILVDRGAKAIITYNKISDNICKEEVPGCGTDWINDSQGFGISIGDADTGSTISNNYVSNNDVGIGVFGTIGCCIIDHNKLTDNLIFSIVVGDSEHTISNTKIFGGGVGVLAAAVFENTTATLDHVKIIGAEIPIQALSTGNLNAAVNVVSPYFLAP